MFPKMHEETRDLAPMVYFGGREVPPYCHLHVPTVVPLPELVASIRSIGETTNCSGYIDEDGVHFHPREDDTIWVDLSKEFVFVSQPGDADAASPSAWQVLFFLMEPVRRVLLIGTHDAILLEKTDATMKLCRALDLLWDQESFLDLKMAMSESDEAREKGLACLMKIHEDETTGESSEMWEFWDVFSGHLMPARLGLRVQTVGVPSRE